MNIFSTLLISLFSFSVAISQNADEILMQIDQNKEKYVTISKKIWSLAELGYQEYKSSDILQELLVSEGFTIEKGVAGIPTAFIASYGQGSPVIGILAEFDALPGVSQDAVPERKEITVGGNGHACGHHLFGTASSAAAIAAKNWLTSSGQPGTIKLFGTPAEEGGGGKVYMVRAGLFDDIDVVLHWHPSSGNSA